MKHVVFVYGEGPHDIAFAVRTLGAKGYVWWNRTLKDIPRPFGPAGDGNDKRFVGPIIQRLTKDRLLDAKVSSSAHPSSPTLRNALTTYDGETLLLFFDTHGKDAHAVVGSFMQDVSDAWDTGRYGIRGYAHVFLNDADSDIDVMLSALNEQRVKAVFPTAPLLQNRTWVTAEGVQLGCFIFTGSDGITGTLEDSLEAIGQAAWKARWPVAQSFVDGELPALDHSDLVKVVKRRSDRIKAVMTICGQPEEKCAGAGQSKTIGLIDTELFATNPQSQALAKFFESIPW